MILAQPRGAFRLQPSLVGASCWAGYCGLSPRKGYWKGQSLANGNAEAKEGKAAECAPAFSPYSCLISGPLIIELDLRGGKHGCHG
jgi:hypothetical protein